MRASRRGQPPLTKHRRAGRGSLTGASSTGPFGSPPRATGRMRLARGGTSTLGEEGSSGTRRAARSGAPCPDAPGVGISPGTGGRAAGRGAGGRAPRRRPGDPVGGPRSEGEDEGRGEGGPGRNRPAFRPCPGLARPDRRLDPAGERGVHGRTLELVAQTGEEPRERVDGGRRCPVVHGGGLPSGSGGTGLTATSRRISRRSSTRARWSRIFTVARLIPRRWAVSRVSRPCT